ncbi:MAG: serine/threonine protein kinase [Gammaproteobacteria bacterium]|nr:serine/threonine protein kinase [Gammaproteobacteria bacterium]NNC76914.1 serine/threonine protein kinase [Woeseiaceae bacterium]
MQEKLLKKDLFGEVRLESCEDSYMIVRDAGQARFWLKWLARALMRREARILAALDGLHSVPQLVRIDKDALARTFIDGRPMQEAQPRDPAFFDRASRLLRRLHTAGIVHNDLAKEPNILVDEAGNPAFIDFQLAGMSTRRGRLFRALAYDDIRHLLKHKRTYCPQALTARERNILNKPSYGSRIWMRTVKPVYLFITRRILGWSDREGAADRGRQN